MTFREPTLLFFRHRPADWATRDYIASSMQSLETSLFLIASRRYPHALLVCASAIESALKAADIGAKKGASFRDLIENAKNACKPTADLGDTELARSAIREIESHTVDSALKMTAKQ